MHPSPTDALAGGGCTPTPLGGRVDTQALLVIAVVVLWIAIAIAATVRLRERRRVVPSGND